MKRLLFFILLAAITPAHAASDAAQAAPLRAKLDAWRKAVDAQPPTPNPNYQPKTNP